MIRTMQPQGCNLHRGQARHPLIPLPIYASCQTASTFSLIMDQTIASTCTNWTGENPTPKLFNDVRISRWEPPGPCGDTTWPPFSRLPIELRLHLWLSYLRRHRMIEVDICDTSYPDDASQSRYYYTNRNHLGKIVSGRGYTLSIRGRRCHATPLSLSPLLWVNNEARRAALSFYHVHLPFPGPRPYGEQVLYLNPEYGVVYVRPYPLDGIEAASALPCAGLSGRRSIGPLQLH